MCKAVLLHLQGNSVEKISKEIDENPKKIVRWQGSELWNEWEEKMRENIALCVAADYVWGGEEEISPTLTQDETLHKQIEACVLLLQTVKQNYTAVRTSTS